jgi:hypothetical protein
VADTPLRPGTVLAGRFSLDDLLDDSEGARLWRATDQVLARSVAVHVLPESDPRADALLTAARTSALVTDGHLLRVLDAAAESGVVYVVNEWGTGVSLDRLLAEGPLSPRRAAWVVKEVAEAIATAHRNGVAHGRLLPENVIVTDVGSVKLLGFVVDAVLRSQAGRDQRRVTGGEPMSAHEADVVNLGALLYAALVGRWPGTEGSTLPPAPAEHGRPLRPRQVRAGVPRPLDAICERVLNAGPHAHAVPIETAHEVYAALSDYIGDPTGAPQYEPTSLLEVDDLVLAHDEGTSTELHPSGLEDTAAHQPTEDSGSVAAEQTQAGVPVFFDEDTGVGWMPEPDSRGLRSDGTRSDGTPGSSAGRTAAGGAPGASGWSTPDPSPDAAHDPAAEPDRGRGPRSSTPRDRTRAPAATRGVTAGRDAGPRNGSVPAAWGPDGEDDVDEDGEWSGDRSGRPGTSWLRLAAVVAVVLAVVIGIVFAFNLGRGTGGDDEAGTGTSSSPSPKQSTGAPVRIAAVSDFDPQGDPSDENPQLAPLAVDGKPGTAWRTLTYKNNPRLGGLKSGVGLLVDLGKPTAVGSVRVTLMGSPTAVEILAAPDARSEPQDTDGLDKVASDESAGTRADLELDQPVRTRWLVVWLTSLPSAPGGYQGRVAEITVSS